MPAHFSISVFPLQNTIILSVGLPGLEPGTSSLSEKHDCIQGIPTLCKTPANTDITQTILFPRFQHIGLGYCTVAAQRHPHGKPFGRDHRQLKRRYPNCLPLFDRLGDNHEALQPALISLALLAPESFPGEIYLSLEYSGFLFSTATS